MIKVLGFFCLYTVFFAASSGIQLSTGPHGGVMKRTGEHHIEMNNPDMNFYCWLLDKNANPTSNKNITCEAKFFFPDNTILDSKAQPFGEDGFVIENAGEFLSCQVTFHVQGKTVSAKFESTTPVVRE